MIVVWLKQQLNQLKGFIVADKTKERLKKNTDIGDPLIET